MKLNVYSVYDKAVGAFMSPFYCRSAGEAIRGFTELANDPQTNVGKHPMDFILFGLGEFDDNSGVFTGIEPLRMLSGIEVKEVPPDTPITAPRTGVNGPLSTAR